MWGWEVRVEFWSWLKQLSHKSWSWNFLNLNIYVFGCFRQELFRLNPEEDWRTLPWLTETLMYILFYLLTLLPSNLRCLKEAKYNINCKRVSESFFYSHVSLIIPPKSEQAFHFSSSPTFHSLFSQSTCESALLSSGEYMSRQKSLKEDIWAQATLLSLMEGERAGSTFPLHPMLVLWVITCQWPLTFCPKWTPAT